MGDKPFFTSHIFNLTTQTNCGVIKMYEFDTWPFFHETGDIEAYLLYRELNRLLDSETAEEIALEKEHEDEREITGTYPEGDQPWGSG